MQVYDNIIRACGELEDKPSPKEVAFYVKAMLDQLNKTYGAETAQKVIKPCGHQCISDETAAKAKSLYKSSENIEDFPKLLNEKHIGGGKLHLLDGKIIGVYDKCYCNLPKIVDDMPPVYLQLFCQMV